MVSVIVPVYNAELYLNKCIDSILNQTYSDIELILLDDGSKDKSPEICDLYAEKDSRVRVFHLNNGGPSRARNVGIDKAKGEFLAFVDSDDYIAKDMLESMVLLIDNTDIAMCNFYFCTDGVNKFCNHNMGNMQFDINGIRENFMLAFYYSSMTGLGSCWNKLYNMKFITANNIRFNEKLIRAEDFWFNFECFNRASTVTMTDEAYYYYMQVNPNSTMHQVRDSQYDEWVNNSKELLKRNNNLNLEIDENKFYRNFLYNVPVYLRELLLKGNYKKEVLDILRDEFYLSVLNYDKYLPKHIRLLNSITKRSPNMAYLFIKLWSKLN